jgi:hypothetical protein
LPDAKLVHRVTDLIGRSSAFQTISLDTILDAGCSFSAIPLSVDSPRRSESSSKRFGAFQTQNRILRSEEPSESQSGARKTPC